MSAQPSLKSKKNSSPISKNKSLDSGFDEIADSANFIKVLNETIKVKESQLKKSESSLARAEQNVADLQNELRKLGVEKNTLLEDIIRVRKGHEAVIKELQVKIDSMNFQLRQLNAEIADRQKYLEEQELVIAEVLESGSEELRAVKYQLEAFDRSKQEVENEIFDTKKILQALTDQIAVEAGRLTLIRKQNEEDEALLQEKIVQLMNEITVLVEKQATIDKEIDAKLAVLKEKEISIVAREGAIEKQTNELNIRERRLSSAERLYT